MQPSPGQLTAAGVQRQLTVQRDPLAAFDELTDAAMLTETQRLQPHHGQEAESVIELGHVDVRRPQRGVVPQRGSRVVRSHRREVETLLPGWPFEHPGTHRLHRQRVPGQTRGGVAARHDDGGGAVTGHIAVVEAQRFGDHPGRQVVVHRHRVAVDRIRVQPGVSPGIERDRTELLTGEPEFVHVALGRHGQPVGGGQRAERRRPFHLGRQLPATAEQHRGVPAPGLRGRGRLPHRPEHHHVIGQSQRHRHAGLDHRADLTRGLQ